MRILNKIQLIVEFRVSFMQVTTHRQFFTTWYIFITVRKRWGGSTIDCITQQIQSTLKYTAYFMQVIKCRQFFVLLTFFYTCRKTATMFNLWLYCVANTTSRCEFGLGFLILVTLWMLRHVTTCVFLSISFQFLIQALSNCKR